MSGAELVFSLLGLVALGSAVLVVTTSRIVHAALWLVVTLGALAGCYLVLMAEFVAWVQVLIYLGAVVVLLLFSLMLTRAPTGSSTELTGRNRWVALGVAGAMGVVLLVTLQQGWSATRIDLDEDRSSGGAEVGEALFRTWVWPFEVLSVLLLAALVGAIVLSRSPETQDRDAQRSEGP